MIILNHIWASQRPAPRWLGCVQLITHGLLQTHNYWQKQITNPPKRKKHTHAGGGEEGVAWMDEGLRSPPEFVFLKHSHLYAVNKNRRRRRKLSLTIPCHFLAWHWGGGSIVLFGRSKNAMYIAGLKYRSAI